MRWCRRISPPIRPIASRRRCTRRVLRRRSTFVPTTRSAGSLRRDLASFRALEAFAQRGTGLDTATQRQLDRGRRMVELLKQPQYQPYELADQVISIFAGTQGFLDDLPVPQVLAFEA